MTETIVYHHAYVVSDEGILVVIKGYRGNGSIVVVHFLDRGNKDVPIAAFLSAISYCGLQEQIVLGWRCPVCGGVNKDAMDSPRVHCDECRAPLSMGEAIEQGMIRVGDRYSGDSRIDLENEAFFGISPVPFASIFGAPAIRH